MVDVTRFGASGKDGKLDTAAFQKAVDACAAAGGGTVVVPPGEYLVGRVCLKDNVTLHLAAGAVLRPSTDKKDYPPIAGGADSAYQAANLDNALNSRYAVIYALNAKHIGITGQGAIRGDGEKFWTRKNSGDFPKWNCVAPWFYYTPNAFRPMLVLLEDCTDVLLRDVSLDDAPCYAGWLAGCRNVHIDHVKVRANQSGPNTDGFHFSSCRTVHITDCDFVCGDDCIAIDPNHRGPSANFTITGCAFNTTVNVFRIYTGLDPGLPATMPRGQVTDISASNCTVEDASGVFNVTAEKGDVARLAFSNFTINQELRGSAFFLLTLGGGSVRDVTLSNMAIRTDGIGSIAADDGPIEGVTLRGLRYEVCPHTKLYGNAMPEPLPGYGMHHFAPYFLFVRHARDIALRDISVRWGKADLADLDKVPGGHPSWGAVHCLDVTGLDLDAVACTPYGTGEPAIRLSNVRDALITHCRAAAGTGEYLRVEGKSTGISLIANDLARAAKAVALGDGVPADAVTSR